MMITIPMIAIMTLAVITSLSLPVPTAGYYTNAYAQEDEEQEQQQIQIKDPNLHIELVSDVLIDPTAIAFVGPDDVLVLEKDGKVQRIVDGKLMSEPLLELTDVTSKDEQGLLGIAVSSARASNSQVNSTENAVYVFLYYTRQGQNGAESADADTDTDTDTASSQTHNVVYRYELVGNKLINPKLLTELPALPGPSHAGGALTIGPDNNLYIAVGEQRPSSYKGAESETKAQNYVAGKEPDGRGGILRITQNGEVVIADGIVGGFLLGNEDPLNKYYAYGIRNSFGIDFDPVTGYLWDTENGPSCCDEINLVLPGFNSGWAKITGFWPVDDSGLTAQKDTEEILLSEEAAVSANPNTSYGLVDFDGKGRYSNPEFVWYPAVGPTAIKFFTSDKLGKEYQNDMFVADAAEGRIYHFDLNENRTSLVVGEGELADKIADTIQELEYITFAQGFGIITDLEVGPHDGYLYVVSGVREDKGMIHRIVTGSM
jgi:glucose/arabinose dehydrogenase